jgi:hypothetical protein
LINRSLEGFPPLIINELQAVMPQIPPSMHELVLDLTGEAIPLSCEAAVEFLRNCPFVTGRVKPAGLELWFREGLELLQKSEQSGIE